MNNRSKAFDLVFVSTFGIAVIFALLFYLGDLSPKAYAETFTVDTFTDENDGECEVDCSLRDAIILANSNPGGDVITLDQGTYTLSIPGHFEDDSVMGDLDITDPITITGQGPDVTIIDGNNIDRIFDMRPTAGRIVLTDLSIINGTVGGTLTFDRLGGGIYSNGELILDNVIIKNNSAYFGGGIYIKTGSVMMTGTTIIENDAQEGGGVFIEGNTTITGGTLTGNSSNRGGALFVGPGSAILNDLEIDNNDVTSSGGGVYVASGSATLNGGHILENSAFTEGGGFYLEPGSGSMNMDGGCIVNNSDLVVLNDGGVSFSITNAWWGDENGPAGEGSGIGDSVSANVSYAPFLTTTVDCPYRAEEVDIVDVTNDEYDGECNIDCSLRDAIAKIRYRPATIVLGPYTYTLSISGENEDMGLTGDLDVRYPITINGSGQEQTIIDGNHIGRIFDLRPGAGRISIANLKIINGGYDEQRNRFTYYYGGGIYNADSDLYLNDVIVKDSAADLGGGVYIAAGNLTMSGASIDQNTALKGGGIFIQQNVTITGGLVCNNSSFQGAGVYVGMGNAILNDMIVSGNESTSVGGGLYVASGSATLTGGYFFNNQAISNGSAIYLSNVGVSTSMTSGCIANNSDIAVYNDNSESMPIINSWWGSSTGPSGAGPGVGDSVSSNVVYDPFQTVSNGCPPRANASIYMPNILKQ